MNETVANLVHLLVNANEALGEQRVAALAAQRVAQGLEADLNAAVESNRTLAASEAASNAQAQEIVRASCERRDRAEAEATKLREMNSRQRDKIHTLEAQLRAADAARLETEARLQNSEANLRDFRAAWVTHGEREAQGVPKGRGLTRDEITAAAAAQAGSAQLQLVSPWLHGPWQLVAIYTEAEHGAADIVLRPAYGTNDGVWISGRIDRLQLDDYRF